MAKCALCREEAILRKSHLLPSSAFRVIAFDENEVNSKPTKVDFAKGTAVETNEQLIQKLLCGKCEDRFSKYGEKIVGSLWATSFEFPLLKKVMGLEVIGADGSVQIYDSRKLLEIEREALYYFALSIVWRSYVWDWASIRQEVKRTPLGEKYAEIFRQFLLGGERPKNTYLYALVYTDSVAVRHLSLPTPMKAVGYTVHKFDVPGITFLLMVGGGVSSELLRAFRMVDDQIVVMGQDYRSSDLFSSFVLNVRQNVVPKGKLASRKPAQ